MAVTTHWAPNSAAISVISSGRCTAEVLTLTLSAPARSSRRASSTERMPPPTVKGMNTSSAVRASHLDHRVAAVARRRDVEEHQLVGAFGVVAGGQLHRVAGVAQADEVDALDDAAVGDVEARDDPGGAHTGDGSGVARPRSGRHAAGSAVPSTAKASATVKRPS